ncbi:transposase zinc-binding domain-containing protein [Clostridium tagluense]|uniref:transposase zinc-binding domain-containing protein n=1 Tax=Clostridium tagluense TaxID=360422 RepID=UPI001CF27697|nr:transposase zinc-binding domain-containing protein [Clostridium tagluense]MCB2301095.1 transposase zinc-binding domain-containing protein [Clostridium tagluense]
MKKNKITIKQIFEDNYQEFWKGNKEKYPEKMREHMNIEVMKMMGCGDISLGFVAYICLKCGQLMELWQIWHRKYGYIYDMGTY